ncbi:hypothetical protein CN126_13415 [Sinorhizobium meliloti]|nr:hypothetical protein CN162_14780 [Sinorhizobium meliloti]RVM76722.1 hypothetical protein CN126_13415 [Sinorhizobium meliloti]RVM80678.1 hypothetical protein CN122_31670 [Sinorhizobium meliloti]RVN76139.1 hypothetical protein CN110_05010 [Sinorhizobium meliloti]
MRPIHAEPVSVLVQRHEHGREVALVHPALCGSANVLSGDCAHSFLLIVVENARRAKPHWLMAPPVVRLKVTLVAVALAGDREARRRPKPLTGLAIDPHQWKWDSDMDDSEAKSAGRIEPASDLSEIAARCANSNLLDLAAQLADLAEDLKALAARPIEPIPTLAEPEDQPEGGFPGII